MSADLAVEHANYYRDTPSLCVVEIADDTFVVTNTVAQAEALRTTLDGLRGALRSYVTSPRDTEPAKRAPRKAQA